MRPSTYLPGLEPSTWHEEAVLRVLSFGGGIQSTAIALLAEQGAFGIRPDAAIFADTKAEPEHVYANVKWTQERVSYPIHVIDNGRSLYEDVWNGVNQDDTPHILIPVFVQFPDKPDRGMLRRQCTSRYKIQVIRRKVREMLKEKGVEGRIPANLVEQWMGISMDESVRMRDSDVQYIYHYYPLIESLGWTRTDCAKWLRKTFPQHEVRKSACIFCPFHDDAIWQSMREEQPEDFNRAAELDERLRADDYPMSSTKGYMRYLHSSLKALREIDFDGSQQFNHFLNECEGHCGV